MCPDVLGRRNCVQTTQFNETKIIKPLSRDGESAEKRLQTWEFIPGLDSSDDFLFRPAARPGSRLSGPPAAPQDVCGPARLDPGGCQQCAMISLRSKAITEADTAIRLQQRGQGADHFCLLVIEISCQKVPKIAQVPTDD